MPDMRMRGCAADIVKKYGFVDAQRASTPDIPGRIISETDCACPGDADAPNPSDYRSRLGSCLWLCRCGLAIAQYGWTGQQSGSGFCDRHPATLGVFASLDRF
jgi:hypothetical protein